MVGLVFAMQGVGLVVGPLLAAVLLASGLSHEVVWRVLLAIGAIPGLAVFYLRRQIHETPRFAMAGGAVEEARAAIAQATGRPPPSAVRPMGESRARNPQRVFDGFFLLAHSRLMLLWLLGTATTWFLLDFAYYGNTISSPVILGLVNPHGSLLDNTLIQLAIFAVFALPGYLLAILLIDRSGRKTIQALGFTMMGVAFLLIAFVPGVASRASPFILLFGVSYFFTEFGPNTTTFVYPAELFPVSVRTTGHGISTAAGKMGAFAGAYLFPHMLASWGISGAEIVAGVVSLAGLVTTLLLLPEPKGRSLEDISARAQEGGALRLEAA
jgi:MFS family permease